MGIQTSILKNIFIEEQKKIENIFLFILFLMDHHEIHHEQFEMQVLQMGVFFPFWQTFLHPAAPPLQN